jgi:hypothetical protein
MSEPLGCAAEPCNSCPYRKDVPSGVWSPEEYQKLPTYDENVPEPAFAAFLCHQTNLAGKQTACRGWLSVHKNSIAVRLAVLTGQVTVKQVLAKVRAKLYRTGAAACRAGMKHVKHPTIQARLLIMKLRKKIRAGDRKEKGRKR